MARGIVQFVHTERWRKLIDRRMYYSVEEIEITLHDGAIEQLRHKAEMVHIKRVPSAQSKVAVVAVSH